MRPANPRSDGNEAMVREGVQRLGVLGPQLHASAMRDGKERHLAPRAAVVPSPTGLCWPHRIWLLESTCGRAGFNIPPGPSANR